MAQRTNTRPDNDVVRTKNEAKARLTADTPLLMIVGICFSNVLRGVCIVVGMLLHGARKMNVLDLHVSVISQTGTTGKSCDE